MRPITPEERENRDKIMHEHAPTGGMSLEDALAICYADLSGARFDYDLNRKARDRVLAHARCLNFANIINVTS